jgi:hypothetical protein
MTAGSPPSTNTPPRAALPASTGDGSGRRLFGLRPSVGVGAAGKAVADDLSALIKAEIALAKAEVTDGLKAKGAGAGAFGAAAVLGWLGIQGLLITLGFVLAIWLPGWAAALIVTVLLLAGAGIAALVGRKKMAVPVKLDTTKSNVTEDVAVAKAHLPVGGRNGNGGVE